MKPLISSLAIVRNDQQVCHCLPHCCLMKMVSYHESDCQTSAVLKKMNKVCAYGIWFIDPSLLTPCAGPMAWGEVGGAKAMCAVLRDRLLGISWLSGKVKKCGIILGNGKGISPFSFLSCGSHSVFLCADSWCLHSPCAHGKALEWFLFLFLMLILASLTAIFSSTADPLQFTVDESSSVCVKRSSHHVVMR